MANKDDKWVRKVADDYGIDQSLIDYDRETGYVTLAGRNLAKPTEVLDGKSYFEDLTDVYKGFDDYLRENGDAVVKVTDYLAASGEPHAASYTGGVLSVNGQTVPTVRVVDGKSYAKQSDLDRVLSAAETRSNRSVVENAREGYGKKQADALAAIEDREAFSYNPDEDVVYQAYKNQYIREANRAVEDAMAAYSAATGGMTNSMAVTGAGQSREEYMKKLNDVIPTLYAQAYDRYKDEGAELRYLADAYAAAAEQWLSADYEANRDTIEDIAAANKANAERDRDARDTAWEQQMDALDQAQEDRELSQGDRRLDQSDRELSQGDRRLDQSDRELSQGDRRLDQSDRELSQGDRRLDQSDRELDLDEKIAAQNYQVSMAKTASKSAKKESNDNEQKTDNDSVERNISTLSTDLEHLGFNVDKLSQGAYDNEQKLQLLIKARSAIRYIAAHFMSDHGVNMEAVRAYLDIQLKNGGVSAPMYAEIIEGYSYK